MTKAERRLAIRKILDDKGPHNPVSDDDVRNLTHLALDELFEFVDTVERIAEALEKRTP